MGVFFPSIIHGYLVSQTGFASLGAATGVSGGKL